MNKTEMNPLILDILEELKKCNPHILEELKKCNPRILDTLEKLKEYPFRYHHARANIAVDLCSIGILKEPSEEKTGKNNEKRTDNKLAIFIQRKSESELWALPGRYMWIAQNPGVENEKTEGEIWQQTLERSCRREWSRHIEIAGRITDKPVIYNVPKNEDCLFFVGFLDGLERDPRGRVISLPVVTFVGHVEQVPSEIEHVAHWVPIESLLKNDNNTYMLGYDHNRIIKLAYRQLLIEASTRAIGRNLVSDNHNFDLDELVEIYCVLFNKNFSKSNLKKQFETKGLIRSTSTQTLEKGQRRRGERFTFVDDVYDRFIENPLLFSFLPRTKDE